MIATMVMIRLTNKTATTIIIVVLLSVLVFRPLLSSLFSKKNDIENEIIEMDSWINNYLKNYLDGFIFKKYHNLNYSKPQIAGSNHQNRELVY